MGFFGAGASSAERVTLSIKAVSCAVGEVGRPRGLGRPGPGVEWGPGILTGMVSDLCARAEFGSDPSTGSMLRFSADEAC